MNYNTVLITVVIQCGECPNRVNTEPEGAWGWATKGGGIRKGFPEEAAAKLRPEGEAAVATQREGWNIMQKTAYAKGQRQKKAFGFFFLPFL